MCGIIAYKGKVKPDVLRKIVYESGARGLHNFGSHFKTEKEAGIIHARYVTSGEANQPLEHDGRWMAFNGVINMGTKEEMEAEYGLELKTDNDGEVMLQLCKTPSEAVDFLKKSRATFAGVWLEDDKLVALRNPGRPLWVHHSPEAVIIASTRDIFKRAGITENVAPLEPYRVYEWSL